MNYDEFRRDYEAKHPGSVPRMEYAEVSEYPAWVHWVVLAMFLSAAILSGVHTVPTVYDTIEPGKVTEAVRQIAALLSFIAVETSTLLASYMLFKKFNLVVFGVLVISLAVATVANLYSVGKALEAQELGIKVVAVTLGLGMPFLAVLAGKLYVNLHNAERRADLKTREQYKRDLVDWDRKVQAAWTRAGGDQSLNLIKNNRLNTDNSRNKPSPKKLRVLTFLAENPDMLDRPPRDVAKLIGGVSYGTVHKAQTEMRSNGHNGDEQESTADH